MTTLHSTHSTQQPDLLHGLERWTTPALALERTEDDIDGAEDFVVVAANPAARDDLGGDVIGARLDRDRPFGPMTSLVGEMAAAIRDDEVRVADRTVTGPDAQPRHLRYTMLPSANAVTLFVEDRTIEVRLRRELATTGQTLARVERWGNLGVWELDLTSGSLYWSTQVFEILGLSEPGFDRFMEVVHQDDRDLLDHVGQRAAVQPGPYRVTHRIVRDGETRTLDQHMQSVLGDDGRPARVLGTMIDVTATEAFHQDLHEAVQLRTLGLLAGGVAHDLKNALTVVYGHADLAIKYLPDDSPLRPSIEAISRAGHRACDLTRNLMNLGRTAELRAVPIELSGLFSDVASLTSPSVEAAVEIEPCAPDAPMVVADPSRLTQVLIDLVLNAGDADAHRIVLTFDTVDLDLSDPRCRDDGMAPGRYGAIRVVDDGSGMDAATARRIFEPFFSTKDAQSGSGIGLANAHDFVSRSGGLVEVASEVGTGTTMSILLPTEQPPAADRGRPSRSRPARILVGSAEAGRAEHLSGLLEARAADQVVTAVGAPALAITLDTEPIDVLVLDGGVFDADQLLSIPPWIRTVVVPDVGPDIGSHPDHVSIATEPGLCAVVREFLDES